MSAKKDEAKAAALDLVKVKLLKPHTHAGEQKAAGDSIEVNQIEKAWLIEQKVIAAPAAI